MLVISPHVIVGDATETTVTRTFLTNFITISSHAIVQLQIYDPTTGLAVRSDPLQADRYYTYFPGRIRDISENHDKLRDSMAQLRVQRGLFQIWAVDDDGLRQGNYEKVYPNGWTFSYADDYLQTQSKSGRDKTYSKKYKLEDARTLNPNVDEEVSAPSL